MTNITNEELRSDALKALHHIAKTNNNDTGVTAAQALLWATNPEQHGLPGIAQAVPAALNTASQSEQIGAIRVMPLAKVGDYQHVYIARDLVDANGYVKTQALTLSGDWEDRPEGFECGVYDRHLFGAR